GRRDAQPLAAFRHGRVVDGLNVDAVLGKEEIGRLLALLRIADQYRHDMRVAWHHRQTYSSKHRLHPRCAFLMALALEARGLEMPDGCRRGGTDCRRQGRREDESRGITAHRIDQRRAPRYVAAKAAKR